MQSRAVFSLAAVALLAGTLTAQEPARELDGNTLARISGASGIDAIKLLAIPNRPFSGTSTIEWTQTLEDGTIAKTHVTAFLARDSQGRIYGENHMFAAARKTSPLVQIRIYDPVTRSQTHCSTLNMACLLTDYEPQTEPGAEWPYVNVNHSLARESLGSATIEGIDVSGTRETTTVESGVLGNDQPLVSAREFWFSEELQTNLAVTRIVPDIGKQTISISNISREEPDSHLFDLSSSYKVYDLRTAVQRKR